MLRPRPESSVPGSSSASPVRPGLSAQLADALATRLLESTAAEAVVEQVLRALIRSPALQTFTSELLAELETSSALDALVDKQVERILRELETSETLRTLVQEQATSYLAHLEAHPERIRRLVRTESRGAMTDFLDGLRGRAMAADDAVDQFARRVLRKK